MTDDELLERIRLGQGYLLTHGRLQQCDDIRELCARYAAARVELGRWRNGSYMDEQYERLTDMAVSKAREHRDAARADAERLRIAMCTAIGCVEYWLGGCNIKSALTELRNLFTAALDAPPAKEPDHGPQSQA